MSDINPRPVVVCRSDRLICPRCGKRMHEVHAGIGSMYATCRNVVGMTQEGGRLRSRRCGQTVFAMGTHEGVAVVVPITKAEFDTLVAGTLKASHVVLSELGALTTGQEAAS